MIELHSSQPSPEVEQCIRSITLDMNLLQSLTAPQARAVYHELEFIRDTLSKILDRADDKLR